MAGAQTRFDLYSRTISSAAVREFDAKPDPVKRFRKYACSITSAEQAAIEAQIAEADTRALEEVAEPPATVRLDPDVAAHFAKAGGDRHRRINEILRASIKH